MVKDKYDLRLGDCIEVLQSLEANSIDSVVCDPPYHLTSIVERFSNTSEHDNNSTGRRAKNREDGYARLSKGFMGKNWDGGDVAFQKETWEHVIRVLKPGGYMLAFSGTRTYHRMVCAIEDAGFEIRDQLAWVYGTGFPKSLNVSKAMDKRSGATRKVTKTVVFHDIRGGNLMEAAMGKNKPNAAYDYTEPATDDAKKWDGWGTALKPAWEPIVLARKPVSEKSIIDNVLKHGTGAINIDGCRITCEGEQNPSVARRKGSYKESKLSHNEACKLGKMVDRSSNEARAKERPGELMGRWPANIIHDGSDEVLKLFPGTNGDSVARFFYCAKSANEREEYNKHPTVKPIELMKHLVSLVTPPGGTVLDPFMGSGTTGIACLLKDFKFIGIELEEDSYNTATQRLIDTKSGTLIDFL